MFADKRKKEQCGGTVMIINDIKQAINRLKCSMGGHDWVFETDDIYYPHGRKDLACHSITYICTRCKAIYNIHKGSF